ncbi:MAG: hypothetical protein Q8R54_01550, partial [Methylobacter sp.]|nr:hypothetical protein [Methylobacter sp.]
MLIKTGKFYKSIRLATQPGVIAINLIPEIKGNTDMKMKSGSEKFLLFGAVKKFIFICCVFFMNRGYAETGQQTNSLAEYKKLIAEQQKEFQLQKQIIAEQGKELER